MRGRRGRERERTYPEGWDGEGDFCGGAGGGAMSGSSKADDRRRDCDRAFDPRRKKTTPYSLLSQGEIERTDEAYVIVAQTWATYVIFTGKVTRMMIGQNGGAHVWL